MSMTSAIQSALLEELKKIDQELLGLATKKKAIQSLLDAYGETSNAAICQDRQRIDSPNTVDMARRVIRNAGRPLSMEEIRKSIVSTFGVEPAKTLAEMLWKKARAKEKGFFKDESGNIGLMEMTPQIETVLTVQSQGLPV